MKRVLILGSTGSIGEQALDVIARSDELAVAGLAARSSFEPLLAQAQRLGVDRIALADERAAARASEAWTAGTVLSGAEGLARLVTECECDVVLNALVGSAGLGPTVAALGEGIDLALANKESLVAGGRACLAAAEAGGGRLLPVDSEHAALAQCLARVRRDEVAGITLTASGGPFRTRSDLSTVTPAEALAHPTWSMGPKITVDSATLMNKGLEVIEAHWLFGFGYDDIGVLVQPQSIVHGLVEMKDSTLLLQAAPTDMRIPIQSALLGDDRTRGGYERVDLGKIGSLEFEDVDHERFPALGLAYRAGRAGGTAPAVLNAANEVAVAAFLDGGLSFTGIAQAVSAVLDRHDPGDDSGVEQVLAADGWARREASRVVAGAAA